MGQPKKRKRGGKKGLPKSHSLTAKAQRAELREKVWDLKIAGLSLRRIAASLGIGRMTAQRYIQRGLKRYEDLEMQKVREYRILHHARLEDMAGRLTLIFRDLSRPIEERLATARVILAAWESDRKLLGLDAPQQIINRFRDETEKDDWESLSDEQLQAKLLKVITVEPRRTSAKPEEPKPSEVPAQASQRAEVPEAASVRPVSRDPDPADTPSLS